jgi:long-chain acyl-CoA synthetase
MERIWLASYPPGVPATIDTSTYASLTQLLEDSFRLYATRRAFVSMGKSMTYGQLDRLSRALATWLQSKGLAPGARVALMMPNVLQYPVAIAAVLRAGYVIVNVNPLYTPRELEYQLCDSGAEAMVVFENFATTLQAVIGNTSVKHVLVASMGDLLGAKGLLVNFVVRRVKKMVPAWSLPNAVRFNAALAEGARRAPPCCIGTSWRMSSSPRPGSIRRGGNTATSNSLPGRWRYRCITSLRCRCAGC